MPGFSDPAWDAQTAMSNLRRDIQHLETQVYQLRTATVPKCFECEKQIETHAQVYRCADCQMPFHRDCIRTHFKNSR